VTFTELVTRVANRTNKNASDSVVTTRIKGHINNICQLNWDDHAWSFRYREYPITTIADVETGTVSATNGSRTLTFSSAVLNTTLHVGAWIRFPEDTVQNWYKVLAIGSTTSCTLEPAYQGTTGATKTFVLKKSDYLLPTECRDVTKIKSRDYPNGMPFTHMSSAGQPDTTVGRPNRAALFNADFKGATYSTGTVSGTIDTNVLTGVGTAWLDNVRPGDCITLGSYHYMVFSVTSDTSLTLYNNLVAAVSGSTYSSKAQFGRYLRLTPSASEVYTVFIGGLRAYPKLVHNSDVNEFTAFYPSAIEEYAVALELGSSPDSREDSKLAVARAYWDSAKSADAKLTPKQQPRPIWSPRQCR
jgi:hypothetical protein